MRASALVAKMQNNGSQQGVQHFLDAGVLWIFELQPVVGGLCTCTLPLARSVGPLFTRVQGVQSANRQGAPDFCTFTME